MNSRIRRTLVVATGIAVLGGASTAFAGLGSQALEQVREREADKKDAESQPAPAAQQPAPRNQQPEPRREAPAAVQRVPEPRANPGNGQPQSYRDNVPRGDNARGDRGVIGELARRGNARGESQRPPVAGSPAPAAQPQDVRGANSGNRGGSPQNGAQRNGQRGVIGELMARNNRGGANGGHDNNHDGSHAGGDHGRPPRIVPTLPRGSRNYYWNNRPYYTFGGGWYEPYGSSFISIGVPYGLFVASLPGYSSSFYYGNTRYYYYDDTYYTYEPVRHGYVVARSPYGDEEDDGYYYDDVQDEDIYMYPTRGQSDQQQADDRYECHRWAVDQTHYNPLDDEYDRTKRAGYLRALTACLTGRGYSVR